MNKKLNIQDLLEKFRCGEASPEELKALYALMKSGRHPKILALMDEQWNTNDEGETYERAENMLKEIHEKAGIRATSKTRFLQIQKVLQYAAVFVLAFMLSWLMKPDSKAPVSDSGEKKIRFFSITVPYGSKSTIVLPDSSKVILNSGSSLRYPDHFDDNDRTVLLHGEAYFDIQRNKQKPFFVKTEDATIKVLGTQFNVKAYPEEKIMETTLVSGSVEIFPNRQVFNDKKQNYKRILLKPNEKAVFTHEGISTSGIKRTINKPIENIVLTAKIKTQEREKTQSDIAWKNDILILSNEPFSEITKKLERWYNVQIDMKNEELEKIRFSARFQGESISDVLHALSLTQPFYYEINKNHIKILTRKN